MGYKINIKERMTKEREKAMGGMKPQQASSDMSAVKPVAPMQPDIESADPTQKYKKLIKIIKPTY